MNEKQPSVYVVGDSTLSSFSDGYYLPRYGYGTRLSRYLGPGVKVVNLALSGRSSKSFLSEENYAALRTGLSHGDFLVIGFGHNDEKREEERYTNPNTPYTDGDTSRGLSFRYNLYKNYICLARERGATPILCTPIVRLSEEDDYSGVCGHVTPTVGGYEGGDYPAAIRRLGRDVGVTVIDLTASSMARYLRLGHEKAADFHAWAGTSSGVRVGLDGTHLNAYGAAWTAYEWAVALSQTDDPLKNYLLPELVPPSPDELAGAVNPDYREPQYRPFDAAAARKLQLSSPQQWYASAMGDFGGAEHAGEFIVSGDGQSITVGNESVVPRGGISSTADGFAAAFMPVPARANFKATARCEVLSLGDEADGRTAFGLMLRDDVFCDAYVPSLCSNYIAAGVAGANAILFREGGALSKGPEQGPASAGQRFSLSVTRINQQLRAEVNGIYKVWFDFDLSAVDGQNDYLCLFACRHVKVRFYDISVDFTGDSVRA